MRRNFQCLLVLIAVGVGQANAAAGTRAWHWSAFGGYQTWDALSELEPIAGGAFDEGGWHIGGAAHWQFRRFERSDLALSLEAAFFAHDSDIPGFDEDLYSRGLYLTPSIEWSRHQQGGSRLTLDLGIGMYLVDFVEFVDCENICAEFDEVFEETTVGGFVGAGFEFSPRSWGAPFLRFRAHFIDLGGVDELGPSAGSLDGPILMFEFGTRWGR